MCGTPAELWQDAHDEKVTAFLKDPACPMITFYVDSVPAAAAADKSAPPAEKTDETPPERTLVALNGMPVKQVIMCCTLVSLWSSDTAKHAF